MWWRGPDAQSRSSRSAFSTGAVFAVSASTDASSNFPLNVV